MAQRLLYNRVENEGLTMNLNDEPTVALRREKAPEFVLRMIQDRGGLNSIIAKGGLVHGS
jgi:hypothetical protein